MKKKIEINLKKGLKINLIGQADKVYSSIKSNNKYVVKPTDFHGLTPKLEVKVGDYVKSGNTIFHDKYNDKIKFCSPVSGEISDIVRGKKRRILEVIIKSDSKILYKNFPTSNASELNREQIIDRMMSGGVWPFIRQKPYDIIANPTDIPKSIFI